MQTNAPIGINYFKFRSKHPGDRECSDIDDHGTDPNRNWDEHFDEGGASDSPCSDTYHGPYAFSENNTQNIRDFVLANADDIAYFMDLHAYSQLAMYPYGFTTTPCADDAALFSLCTAVSKKERLGISYKPQAFYFI